MSEIEFTDRVMSFATEPGQLNVLFRQQAANYQIGQERPDFVALASSIAAAWKSIKPVRVSVRGVEIMSIEAVT